jgi:acetyl-CoA C-acetyltransferase
VAMRSGRIGVVGTAQTLLKSAWRDRQHVDLISEAVTKALRGTGLDLGDVGFVIDSGSDILDGRSISNCGFLGAMGAQGKEESRVEDDGLWSALYATMKIASGSANVGVVLAYSKPSESSVQAFFASQTEPFFQRPVGFDHVAASPGSRRSGTSPTPAWRRKQSPRSWSMTGRTPPATPAVQSGETPDSGRGHRVALCTLRPSPRSTCAQPVDGAVAIIVAAGEIARQVTDRPVWITGMGTAMDEHAFAHTKAWSTGRMRGCSPVCLSSRWGQSAGPPCPSSRPAQDHRWANSWCSRHSGSPKLVVRWTLYDDEDGGPLLNDSGGSLPADPIMATGLVRLSEAALRLSGQCPRGRRCVISHRALRQWGRDAEPCRLRVGVLRWDM